MILEYRMNGLICRHVMSQVWGSYEKFNTKVSGGKL